MHAMQHVVASDLSPNCDKRVLSEMSTEWFSSPGQGTHSRNRLLWHMRLSPMLRRPFCVDTLERTFPSCQGRAPRGARSCTTGVWEEICEIILIIKKKKNQKTVSRLLFAVGTARSLLRNGAFVCVFAGGHTKNGEENGERRGNG